MRSIFRGKVKQQGHGAVKQAVPLPHCEQESQPASAEDVRFVTLFSCRDVSIASVARSKLEYAGIPCYVANEHVIGLTWNYSNLLGGVNVQVPHMYLPMAIALFAQEGGVGAGGLPENDSDEEEPVALQGNECAGQAVGDAVPAPSDEDFLPDIVCPACGSADNVNYNIQRFTALLSLFLSLPLLFTCKRRYRCCACGHVWKQ